METARTSLGKAVSAFRDNLLREIFAKQLFPAFARIHNFQKRTQAQLAHNIRVESSLTRIQEYDRRMRESERLTRFGYPMITAKQALEIPQEALIMPRLITEDTLRPEQDTAYMEMLDKLKENGVPIPLRIWASAAGYDLDKAVAMMEEDLILRKRLDQLSSGDAAAGGSEDLGGDGGDLFSSDGGDSAPPSGQSADDMFKGGDAEKASNKSGNSPTLPPKWGFTAKAGVTAVREPIVTSSRVDMKKVDETLAAFRNGHDPYVKMLAAIQPNLLADLKVPQGRELMPYVKD